MTIHFDKKKKIVLSVCIIIAVAVAAALIVNHFVSAKVSMLADAGIQQTDEITLISHRGMNLLAPENSLEAADKTAGYGYTHIEFDIRQTKDGVWVLMHDEDIKRTTDGKGKVSELTYKQILSCNIDKNCKEYDNVKIPSLDEMLAKCGLLGLHPVIEIKQSGTECIEELMNFLGQRTSECTIIAFDREQIELINELMNAASTSLTSARVELYWLTSDLSNETLEAAKADTSIGVSFNGNKAGDPEEIKKFKDAGIKLATWTIDKPDRLAELYSLGIRTFTTNSITPDGIFTDPIQEVTTNERR
ncbi:MAG: hypothetical protein IJA87_01565 [Clostridia bacterium]|nr:hypothetical protein [Clostridia bacterium]